MQADDKSLRLGSLLAQLLVGSWRPDPPPVDSSQETLPEVHRILLRSGTSGLAWRRLRNSRWAELPPAIELKQAIHFARLQETAHEQEVAGTFAFLRSLGIEPLLAKGWAVARLYPERGLRPYGDVDILCPPARYSAVTTALAGPSNPGLPIDLHEGCPLLKNDRSFGQLHDPGWSH